MTPCLKIPWIGLLLVWFGVHLMLSVPATATPLKVACVGDSITEGYGLANPATESYPAKLQRLLGTGYQVRNFGVSGRTLLKQGDFPYWNEAAFTQSHDYAPDIVIIMLGTNDSKPQNWGYSTNFVRDYEALIASYAALAVPPRIVLATPCPVFKTDSFDINPLVVALEIAPATRDLVARLGLELIDFHTRLAGHGEWFPDTVHPNAKGTTVMAAIVWAVLTHASAPSAETALGIRPITNARFSLEWPAGAAGLVLQSATTLAGTTPWLVVEQVAVNDGMNVSVTNSVSGSLPRFYRLWQP
jgi:acyl-CoA thioesterase-1